MSEDLSAGIARIAEELGLNEKRVAKIGGRTVRLSRVTDFCGDAWVVAVSDLEDALGEKAEYFIVEVS